MNERSSAPEAHKLDRTDWRLLAAVQEDSSRSTSEIADLVGLSQAPCWRRLQKLRELGFIKGEVALLDRQKLGWTIQLLVQVQLSRHGRADVGEFTREMAKHERVLDCFIMLGSVDAVLRVVARDIADYEKFFYEILSQAPGVREANSMVVLTEAKSTTKLPTGEGAT
jgi:Lrp/AsnC family transcriptional regulator